MPPETTPSRVVDLTGDDVLRIVDAARLAKVSRTKLYEEMDRGKLASIRLGRCRRILRSDLEEYLRAGRVPAGSCG